MQSDPGETRNLARDPDFGDVLAEHKRLLSEWEGSLVVSPEVPRADTWRRG